LKIKCDEKEQERDRKLILIGNLVHDSVPVSKTEDDNTVVFTWPAGEKPVKKAGILAHDQVLERLAGYDSERGT
jgi:seryl-tRNA synthetase